MVPYVRGGADVSCFRIGEAYLAGTIVAVSGDANELTARRSTAARSASHIHALLRLK